MPQQVCHNLCLALVGSVTKSCSFSVCVCVFVKCLCFKHDPMNADQYELLVYWCCSVCLNSEKRALKGSSMTIGSWAKAAFRGGLEGYCFVVVCFSLFFLGGGQWGGQGFMVRTGYSEAEVVADHDVAPLPRSGLGLPCEDTLWWTLWWQVPPFESGRFWMVPFSPWNLT